MGSGVDGVSDIEKLKADIVDAVVAAATLDTLEAVRVQALGKQGSITALLKTLGGMSPDERLVQGPRIQGVREAVTTAIAERKAALDRAELDARLARETLDMTLPAEAAPQGSVHPVSQVLDEMAEIFADLGFAVATGPEIEDQWHNFTALNMPESHPARAMHDTFYLSPSPLRGEGRGEGDAATGGSLDISVPPLSPTLSPEGEREKIALSYTPEPAEAALALALDSAEPAAAAAVAREDFEAAMAALATLRAPIDAFFEGVIVNDPVQEKRAARLALLDRVRAAVHNVADFSKIEG